MNLPPISRKQSSIAQNDQTHDSSLPSNNMKHGGEGGCHIGERLCWESDMICGSRTTRT